MKIFLLFFFFFTFLTFQIQSQDTFSIVAVDSLTGEVGAAGATCLDGSAQFGGVQIINKLIPGKGGVNAQAFICISPNINLDNAIAQMNGGSSPDAIIEWLQGNDACSSQNFNPAFRQYGVVDFDSDGSPRAAAFTGASADDYKGHRVGSNYAIQGNILLGPEILEGIENGFNNTTGSLAQKLMAAIQGANVAGADARCLGRGTSSTTAFLRVYRPDDLPNNPYLELNILEMPFGEEPIDSLQNLFDAWQLTSNTSTVFSEKNFDVTLSPNPVNELLQIRFKLKEATALELHIYNLAGQNVLQTSLEAADGFVQKIDTQYFPQGIYYLHLQTKDGTSKAIKFVKN